MGGGVCRICYRIASIAIPEHCFASSGITTLASSGITTLEHGNVSVPYANRARGRWCRWWSLLCLLLSHIQCGYGSDAPFLLMDMRGTSDSSAWHSCTHAAGVHWRCARQLQRLTGCCWQPARRPCITTRHRWWRSRRQRLFHGRPAGHGTQPVGCVGDVAPSFTWLPACLLLWAALWTACGHCCILG